jgi:hypothetical protein
LSSVSKHNMWSYYDWVVVVVFRQYLMKVILSVPDDGYSERT